MEIQQIGSNTREILWEKEIIRIPFNTDDERDNQIYKLLNYLKEKIEKLERERGELEILRVTYDDAKSKVVGFLKLLKSQGHGKVDLFELSHKLKLPATQVEDILEELQKEGFVAEV